MGQYWGKGEEKGGGIVKTATVKTICDGSAERAATHHTSQGVVTGRYGEYSGLGLLGSRISHNVQ